MRALEREGPLAIGDFVRVTNGEFSLGKLASLHGDIARVTWFHSPAVPVGREEEVPVSLVERVELGNQHRVYHHDPATGAWRVGRITDSGRISGSHFGMDGDLYFVAFPNSDTRHVPIAQLEIRWDQPLDDPASILAARTTVTPFWHEGRTRLMRSAMAQRAACGGLTGLFSASIDLLEHQVRVVRTVLNDPIPRYLLADEVGLGKTIEALAILRQLVLEHPRDHATLIVTPPHLREQWQEELTSRFHLSSLLGDSIRIIDISELAMESPPRLLIVDEAHHPAGYAHAPKEEEQALYCELARLAHAAPRLLLLSATPVLHNEDGFLAMLHLLDPVAYPLEDRGAFRERISKRQQVADWLGDLQDDGSPLFMEEALDGLSGCFAEDALLLELVQGVRHLVEEDEEDVSRQKALASLRSHVGEVYRLHRRMLRTRRVTLADPLWGRAGAQVIACEDLARADAERLLLEWRGDLMLEAHRQEALRPIALVLWRYFLEAGMSHPLVLRELAVARLERRSPVQELAICPEGILHAPFFFEGEEERLRELVELLDGYRSTRDIALLEYLVAHAEDRFVVFVDRLELVRQLHEMLVEALGDAVRLRRTHDDVVAFTRGAAVRVLLCDASAEEGLNLNQSPATIVHYDLPLAPNRIEQRLGRLDRIGAKRRVNSVVFDDGAPLATAWLELLRSPIGVFDASIASLQYVLDEHLHAFVENSFTEGLDAFEALGAALRHDTRGLAAELARVRHQEGLDALETDPHEHEWFEGMEDLDLDDERLQEELESWLVDRLMFQRETTDAHGWRRRYRYRPMGSRSTLIPLEHWLRWFRGMVDGARDTSSGFVATPELTYRRRQAHLHRLPLVRIGHPIFDGAVAHATRDDRGVAFAMWRCRPSLTGVQPQLAFRFDFMIDAAPERVIDQVQGHEDISTQAVQRRLDALLPPRFLILWLDDELEVITETSTLGLLEEPYRNERVAGGRDWNLVDERWAVVDERCPVPDWQALVQDAEAEARRCVDRDHSLAERCRGARRELAAMEAKAMAQLAARLERLEGPAQEVERSHLERERMLFAGIDAALGSPRVRLDSMGAVFLARDSPFDRRGP